eukprot:COSAG01_NODE_216_length_21695_cov_83.368772_15_plen_919_part_00
MFNKKGLVYGLSLIFVVIPLFKALLNLYPEFLWFDQFGFSSIWLFVFFAKWKVFIAAFVVASIWLWSQAGLTALFLKKTPPLSAVDIKTPFAALNVFLKQMMLSAEQSKLYQQSTVAYNWLLRGVLLGAALLLSFIANASWETIYDYIHQVQFGLNDPVFSKDISFYFFSLPFYEKLHLWLFLLWTVSFGFVVWRYFTRRVLFSIFSISSKHRAVKIHVFSLLACLFLLFAWRSALSLYGLLYSADGVVYGAGYTDLVYLLPVLKIVIGLLLVLAFVFFVSGFLKRLLLPFFLLALLLIFYFVGGTVIPGFIQNYIVAPNELEKEKTYINRSIALTRKAYGLDQIKAQQFDADVTLSVSDLRANKTTLDNVRLWNQEPLQQTFSQLQEIRLYYEFFNIDVDRYMINGVPQQVMLSPREMDPLQLPAQAQTWINRHLVYTHGYGICMSPVNEISKEGLPKFYIKDIPPKSKIDLQVTRPEIYFGEKTNNYIVVNTKQEEFDYPKGDSNVYAKYQGKGGIVLDSLIKRLFFSFKFSDIKILISSLIQSDSRMMYDRQIRVMVKKIAPFLAFDRDPYLIVTKEGRLLWMLDAYTLSDRFPYSEPYKNYFNYIRNAVKVSVDAYNGEMNFYVVDDKDPIIRTYQNIYKGLFKPMSQMPESVKNHMRYPKDLFTVQAEMYSTYHMTDPQVFYNREDLWKIPQEQYGENQQVMNAYYMVTKLPGDKTESFIQMLPFNPTNKNNMIAWMSVKCDADDYGELKVFKFPKDKTIYGPMQIESRIDQDTDISQKLTLWGQVGSRVIRGNLMVVPIESSLIYVEPIYLQATQSKLPELKRVIFAYGDQIVMSETLNQNLEQVFGASFDGSQSSQQQVNVNGSVADIDKDTASVMQKIKQAFKRVKAAAADFDWSRFGSSMNDLQRLIEE